MVSTFPPWSETVTRNKKGPPGEDYQTITINRPSNVRYCNKGMGGTDDDDHMMALYRT